MVISDAFKKDTLSKNTQVIPLVVIEKITQSAFIEQEAGSLVPAQYKRHFISTHNIEVDENYFKPLLLKMPKLSQNLDFSEGKFKVSSMTLDISNVNYNNSKKISEELDNYSFMNAVVCIHHKTQSCTKIELPNQDENGIISQNIDNEFGCPRVFTGVVRGVSHQKDKMTLKIEDATHKNIARTLPNVKLDSTDNVPEKYKNSYMPIFYGDLENAPTIAYYEGGYLRFRADSEPINLVRYDELTSDITWVYNSLKLYSSQYLPLTKKNHVSFVSEEDSTQETPHFEVTGENQYVIMADGSIAFTPNSMLIVADRVEVASTGKPQSINLSRNVEQLIDTSVNEDENDPNFGSGTFSMDYEQNELYIDESDYNTITDDDYDSFINENQTSDFSWTSGAQSSISHAILILFSLQWDSGIKGAKFTRVINNKINNIKIPVKGDANVPSGFGIWDNAHKSFFITNLQNLLQDPAYGFDYSVNRVVNVSEASLTNLLSFGSDDWHSYVWNFSGQTNQLHYNENAPFKLTIPSFSPLYGWYNELGEEFEENWARPDLVPIVRLSHDDNSIPSAGQGYSSFELALNVYGGGYGNPAGGNVNVNIDLDIQEIDVTAVANFDKAIEKNYYLNAKGRVDNYLHDYTHEDLDGDENFENPVILENPVDIIRHILVQECGVSNDAFHEPSFNRVWTLRHNEGNGYPSYIKLAFSVKEEINSKKVLSNISKNSLVFPVFRSDGTVGFVAKEIVPLAKDYSLQSRTIDNKDIINYKFDLTPSTDLVSKVDVEYGYDYEQNKNLKTTESIEMADNALEWYGIANVDDSALTYKADYIQDEQSAERLRDIIFHDRRSQHLEIELTLPLSYSDIELGDYCKFPINQLIDGIKAHGIDYTKPCVLGTTTFSKSDMVLRMPLFRVTKYSKNLDNIKCTLHQLHWLDTLENALEGLESNDWNTSLWDWRDIDWEGLDLPSTEPLGGGYEETPFPTFPQDSVRFFIGNDSSAEYEGFIGEYGGNIVNIESSYIRKFVIDDLSLHDNPHGEYTGILADPDLESDLTSNYFYLNQATDDLKNLFGEQNFIENGDLEWSCLLNPNNHPSFGYTFPDDYVYNPITVKMYASHSHYNATPYTLRFQNVAGTEFDEEHEMYQDVPIYESYWYSNIPDYLSPPNLSLPHKMIWVAYKSDGTLAFAGQNIGRDIDVIGDDGVVFTKWWRKNLMIKFMSYQHNTLGFSGSANHTYNSYVFEMELNQDQHLQETLGGNLWYNANLSGVFLPEATDMDFEGGAGGSSAPDDDEVFIGQLTILQLVQFVVAIMEGVEPPEEWDLNNDGEFDILDVLMMLNLILGNNNE